MFTSGARAGEVAALQTGDLRLRSDPATAIIRRGKGGAGRVVPLAVEAAAAIDRYEGEAPGEAAEVEAGPG